MNNSKELKRIFNDYGLKFTKEREEIYMIYCDLCKKEIEGGYYESSYADILCEECGEDLLVWNYNLDSFVSEADDKEYYFDDELSDIITYQFVK